MRILVVNTQVPFIHGGAEYLAENLLQNLRRHGHRAEHVKLPFKWYPPETILDHILAARLLDLSESNGEKVDRVIGLKFPAYFARHPNKVLWVLHQHRTAYDLWNTNLCDLSGDIGNSVREAITKADNVYLPESKKIYTIARNVSNRLQKYNHIDSEHLYHPPPNHEKLQSREYENYIFFPSRLSPIKRQHVAVEAMKHVKSNVKLILAGAPDAAYYEDELRELIGRHNLRGRVELLGGIPEDKKIDLYANALGVLFIPYDEDYGYVTLEAFYSKKAVITCTDSGGPLEFVQDGRTGIVCEPEADSIAQAMDSLAENPGHAKRLGIQAYEFIESLDLSWDRVVEALTS